MPRAVGGISLGLNRLRSSAAWAPLLISSLAAWWAISDTSTLFQDVEAMVPVTADNQDVALVLDKSRGAVFGDELLGNVGPFDDSEGFITGWGMQNGATLSSPGGKLRVAGDGVTANPHARAGIGVEIGKTYLVRARATFVSGVNGTVRIEKNNQPVIQDGLVSSVAKNAGVHGFIFTATTDQVYIRLVSSGVNDVIDWEAPTVKEISPFYLIQPTPGNRATYRLINGRHMLRFNGSTDWYYTGGSFSPGTDRVMVCAGIEKGAEVGFDFVCEYSSSSSANNGTFALGAPSAAADSFHWRSRGTVEAAVDPTGYADPFKAVLTGIADISTDQCILRVNGAQAASSSGDQGTGNYGSFALNVGGRNGGNFCFNGDLYDLSVYFPTTAIPQSDIDTLEAYVGSKVGVSA
jgi:hypothetical protein